jgi:hypothetical protein
MNPLEVRQKLTELMSGGFVQIQVIYQVTVIKKFIFDIN